MTVGNTCEIADKQVCEEAYALVRNNQSVGLSNVLTFPNSKKYVQRLLAEVPHAKEPLQRRLAVVALNKSNVGYFVAEELSVSILMDVVLVGGCAVQLKEAAKSIKEEFQKRYPSLKRTPKLHQVEMNTNSLRSVKEAAGEIESIANEHHRGQVHMLVNLSGEVSEYYSETEEGVEVNLGRNYLAPRLLADLLLPLLRAAATDNYKPRLIQEASVGHCVGADFDPFSFQKNPKQGGARNGAFVRDEYTGEVEYSSPTIGLEMYYRSKMALMADTLGLAHEEPMLAVVSCDTGIASHDAKSLSSRVLGLSPSQAARSALRAALDPSFNTKAMYYLHSDGNPWRMSRNTKLGCDLEEYAEIVRCVGDEMSGQLLADKDCEWELWSAGGSSRSLLSPSNSPSVSPAATPKAMSRSTKESLVADIGEPPLGSGILRSSIMQASAHIWNSSFNSLITQ